MPGNKPLIYIGIPLRTPSVSPVSIQGCTVSIQPPPVEAVRGFPESGKIPGMAGKWKSTGRASFRRAKIPFVG